MSKLIIDPEDMAKLCALVAAKEAARESFRGTLAAASQSVLVPRGTGDPCVALGVGGGTGRARVSRGHRRVVAVTKRNQKHAI